MHEHIQFIASLSHIRPLKYICWLYLCSYLPVCTSELLESATEKSIDKCKNYRLISVDKSCNNHVVLQASEVVMCSSYCYSELTKVLLFLVGLASEGVDSVAEAECVVLESLSRLLLWATPSLLPLVDALLSMLKRLFLPRSHVRTVVATLGGKQGAASRFDKWQYLHAGFTVWLSVSDASGKETRKGRLALFCS